MQREGDSDRFRREHERCRKLPSSPQWRGRRSHREHWCVSYALLVLRSFAGSDSVLDTLRCLAPVIFMRVLQSALTCASTVFGRNVNLQCPVLTPGPHSRPHDDRAEAQSRRAGEVSSSPGSAHRRRRAQARPRMSEELCGRFEHQVHGAGAGALEDRVDQPAEE